MAHRFRILAQVGARGDRQIHAAPGLIDPRGALALEGDLHRLHHVGGGEAIDGQAREVQVHPDRRRRGRLRRAHLSGVRQAAQHRGDLFGHRAQRRGVLADDGHGEASGGLGGLARAIVAADSCLETWIAGQQLANAVLGAVLGGDGGAGTQADIEAGAADPPGARRGGIAADLLGDGPDPRNGQEVPADTDAYVAHGVRRDRGGRGERHGEPAAVQTGRLGPGEHQEPRDGQNHRGQGGQGQRGRRGAAAGDEPPMGALQALHQRRMRLGAHVRQEQQRQGGGGEKGDDHRGRERQHRRYPQGSEQVPGGPRQGQQRRQGEGDDQAPGQ